MLGMKNSSNFMLYLSEVSKIKVRTLIAYLLWKESAFDLFQYIFLEYCKAAPASMAARTKIRR